MTQVPNMISGSPVTDLPSGQPINAPAGESNNLIGKAVSPQSQLADNPAQVDPKTPPQITIFQNPPRPFPVLIRGLNFDQLSQYLNAYEMGLYRFIVRIWTLMRKRDEHLLSVSSKRLKRVSRHDWEITPMDSTPAALRQAEFLSDFVAGIKVKMSGNNRETFGLRKAFRHLLTAIGNGYAGCEIEWLPAAGTGRTTTGELATDKADKLDNSGLTEYPALRANLILIRSDFFDETDGVMKLYQDAVSFTAVDVPEHKLLIHRGDEALMIASSILFVMKQIALGQWNDFCNRYGLPALIGESPDGASQVSREEMLKILASWVNNLAAVFPAGYKATITSVMAGAGQLPSAAMVERCEDAMSTLWTGGNLTTKSQAGSGTLAGGAQRDQEIEIAQDDAEDLAETINAQLCAPAVLFQFGEELLCQFKFKTAQQIDLTASITVDVALVKDLGLKISEADLRTKYGWRKPDEEEEVITPPANPTGIPPLFQPSGLRQESSGSAGTAMKAQHEATKTELDAGRELMAQWVEGLKTEIEKINQEGGGISADALKAKITAMMAGAGSGLERALAPMLAAQWQTGHEATIFKAKESLAGGTK